MVATKQGNFAEDIYNFYCNNHTISVLISSLPAKFSCKVCSTAKTCFKHKVRITLKQGKTLRKILKVMLQKQQKDNHQLWRRFCWIWANIENVFKKYFSHFESILAINCSFFINKLKFVVLNITKISHKS